MEENDLMSIFESGLDLNLDEQYFDNTEEDDEIIDDKIDDKNTTTEDEDLEEVGGDEDKDDEGGEDDTSPNLYSSISNVLFEQGLLPSLESSENIKTVDDFTNVLKQEIDLQTKLKVDEYLSNLDLDAIGQSRKAILELDKIDEDYLKDNLEVAKSIILEDYMNQGLSEDRAKKLLRKTVDLGEDVIIEDALESKESLKLFNSKKEVYELERYTENQKIQKIEQEKIDNSIRKIIFESKEVITGIPNTKAISDKVFKTMTEVVAKNPNTGELENKFMNERSKDPIKFDTKMYYLYELTNGFSDLSKIKTTVTSSATKTLEKVLRKTNFEDNGTPGYLTDPNSYVSGIGSELVL